MVMLRIHAVLALSLVAACGGSPPPDPTPPEHLSAAEHHEQAREHDALADRYEQRAARVRGEQGQKAQPIECFDQPLVGVTYSGGEALDVPRPCWSSLVNPSKQLKERAAAHRAAAAEHRSTARALVEAERTACADLGENEIAQSPFAQAQDILGVTPYQQGGTMRGAVITFRRVPGMTGAWMLKSLRCHYARAAAFGFPRTFMAFSPLALPDTSFDVSEASDTIAVTIESPRDEIAHAVLGRAQDLTK